MPGKAPDLTPLLKSAVMATVLLYAHSAVDVLVEGWTVCEKTVDTWIKADQSQDSETKKKDTFIDVFKGKWYVVLLRQLEDGQKGKRLADNWKGLRPDWPTSVDA